MKQKIYSLSVITGRIADILKPATTIYFWVQAEIGEVQHKGRNVYGTMIETNNGKQVAKLSFKIWSNDYQHIITGFKFAGLTLELKTGMKVVFECKLEYHELYGLSLIVRNIDTSFILGEMERRKQEIIKRLKDSGADKKNKIWRVPQLPLRIGLITSRDSAAYADVYKTLQQGGFAFRLSFTEAVMQGEKAEESILRALKIFNRLEVDLVILVRGGGSKTDLATLDNERIAQAIANFTKPVWVAIGHEIDSGVLDLVAHSSFKTPTALAEAIVDRFKNAERNVQTSDERIRRKWEQTLKHQYEMLQRSNNGLRQGIRKLEDFTRSELSVAIHSLRSKVIERTLSEHRSNDMQYNILRQYTSSTINHHRNNTQKLLTNLNSSYVYRFRFALQALRSIRERLSPLRLASFFAAQQNRLAEHIKALSQSKHRTKEIQSRDLALFAQRLTSSKMLLRLRYEKEAMVVRNRNLLANDPRRALQRGYSIVRNKDGIVVNSIRAIEIDVSVEIELYDGTANATINNKEAQHE